jgi:hypothetical protein
VRTFYKLHYCSKRLKRKKKCRRVGYDYYYNDGISEPEIEPEVVIFEERVINDNGQTININCMNKLYKKLESITL